MPFTQASIIKYVEHRPTDCPNGRLYAALFGAIGLCAFSLGIIVSQACFEGDDLDTIYVSCCPALAVHAVL